MPSSGSALETPSHLLKEAQSFYRKTTEIMETPYYTDYNRVKLLKDLADHMEQKVIPEFEKNTAELKKWLADHNVEV